MLYVASSDLSHRLLPGAPAGFDARGAEFDRQIADTFAAGDWRGHAQSIDPALAEAAGECGYRSLAVLSGVVAAAQAAGAHTQNQLYSYEGPFGVGYLVGEVEISEMSQEASVVTDTVHEDKDPLVALARQAIETYVRDRTLVAAAAACRRSVAPAGVFRLAASARRLSPRVHGHDRTSAWAASRRRWWRTPSPLPPATLASMPSTPQELDGLDISVDVWGRPKKSAVSKTWIPSGTA